MISKDEDQACIEIGHEASKKEEWIDYAQYCFLREKDLRKKAFSVLNRFISKAKEWPFEARKEFVEWLCKKMDLIPQSHCGLFPTPLREDLFLEVFEEWCNREPNNAEVFSLRAQYTWAFDYYQEAIAIDPWNQRARAALAHACIQDIWYSTHHLPDHFIGNEQDILQTVKQAREHISYLKGGLKNNVEKELFGEEQLLEDWMIFTKEGTEDFVSWCQAKGRDYHWVKAFNRISIPIPRIFHPFLEEGPFETCLICGCGLLQPGVHYMIEKAFRGTEVIFEYAICLSCSQHLHKELSAESLQRLRYHFEERVDWEERDKRLLKTSRGTCEPWLQHCVITGTPRDQAHAYHLIGHCVGDKLILMFHPFMICEAAMTQMGRLISKKTRDALDNFTDRYLGMPPEFKEVFNDASMLLV